MIDYEKDMVVRKVRNLDEPGVEYRLTAEVRMVFGVYDPIPAPDDFIAAALANKLRELVNSATLYDKVLEKVGRCSGFSCPTCGREVGQ